MKKTIMAMGMLCLTIIGAGCSSGKERGFMSQTCDATSNFSQTWEATTNLTFGGQTSDATTDSTCDSDRAEKFLNDKRLNAFVARNMDNLVVEIASGGGEALDALAEMVEVSSEDRRKFFNALQDHFEDVYTSADITHEALLRNIAGILERMSSSGEI